jgi:hypothetical protein
MAINRFELPANPARRQPYVSQFVEQPYVGLPLDVLGQTTTGLQTTADQNRARLEQLRGMARAIETAPFTPDVEARDALLNEMQGRVNDLSGLYERGYADRRYMSDISQMANQLGYDPRVQKIKKNLEAYQQYQKARQEALQSGTYTPEWDDYYRSVISDYGASSGNVEYMPFGGLEKKLDWYKAEESFFDDLAASGSEYEGASISPDGNFIVTQGGGSEGISNSRIAERAGQAVQTYFSSPEGTQAIRREFMSRFGNNPDAYVSRYKYGDQNLSGVQGYLYDRLMTAGLEKVFQKNKSKMGLSALPEFMAGGGRSRPSGAVGVDTVGKTFLNANISNRDARTNSLVSQYYSTEQGRNKFVQVARLMHENGLRNSSGGPITAEQAYKAYSLERSGIKPIDAFKQAGIVGTPSDSRGYFTEYYVNEADIPASFNEVLGANQYVFSTETNKGIGKEWYQKLNSAVEGNAMTVIGENGQPVSSNEVLGQIKEKLARAATQGLTQASSGFGITSQDPQNHYFTVTVGAGNEAKTYYIRPNNQQMMQELAVDFYSGIAHGQGYKPELQRTASQVLERIASPFTDRVALNSGLPTNISGTTLQVLQRNGKFVIRPNDALSAQNQFFGGSVPEEVYNTYQEAERAARELQVGARQQ